MTLRRLETLPRLVPDGYYDSIEEAYEESRRRKASPPADDAVTRVVESPYGGFRVFTISMEFAIDVLGDQALRDVSNARPVGW